MGLVNTNRKKLAEKVHPPFPGRTWYYSSCPGAVFFGIFQIAIFLSFPRTSSFKSPSFFEQIKYRNTYLEKYLKYLCSCICTRTKCRFYSKCFTDQLGLECLCYKIITRIDDNVSSKLFSVKSKDTFRTVTFLPEALAYMCSHHNAWIELVM